MQHLRQNFLRYLLILFLSVVSLKSRLALSADEVRLSVGTATFLNIFSKIHGPFETETGIKMKFLHPTGTSGDQVFIDVDQDKADGGAGGMEWNAWLDLLKEKGYAVKSPLNEFKIQTIGMDRVRILTFKGGPKTLTSEQIAGLLSGEIKNWKDVGGADIPVRVILSERLPAIGKFISSSIMRDKKFAANALTLSKAKTNDEMAQKIGNTKGAIGFAPLSTSTEHANFPEHPTYGRPVMFLFKGVPSESIQKLLRFIREEGAKHGVPQ